MKPTVLLISQAPIKRKLYVNTLPPLGILSIASFLQRNHISVDVLDCNIENKPRIDPTDYDVVGLSVNMANISASLESIRYIKKQNPKAKVIVGGPSCISNPLYFIQNENIDAICVKEGEETIFDYIRQESFIDGKEIPGLYVRNIKGRFIYGGDRKYINDLDRLPFPALDKVNLKRYNVPISKYSPISSIVTSRGCPFNCIFCFHSMGYEWRARSPANVIDEIEWQVKELGVKEICVQDDNFSLDLKRAKQICDLILSRNINIKLQFQNGLRVDRVDLELLHKMQKAGVWLIGVGPETGSHKIMEEIKKNMDLKKVKQVVRWCQKVGINTYANFMVGFPLETKHDLEKTASFIKELNADFIQIARVIPIPATSLYETTANDDIKKVFGQEQGCFFGIPKLTIPEIPNKDVAMLIKKIHISFYLNPIKVIKLMKILSLAKLIKLFVYSIRTRNI